MYWKQFLIDFRRTYNDQINTLIFVDSSKITFFQCIKIMFLSRNII